MGDEKYLMKEELKELIRLFYEDKQQLDNYKKSTDESNTKIKEYMTELNLTEFKDEDLTAKISIQNRESFNEARLLDKLSVLNVPGVIKTREYVDMDALEDAIYNGLVDASELTSCKDTKTVTTLKVSKSK